MRPLIYVAAFLMLIALGFWAYRENYATRTATTEWAQMQEDIAALHDTLAIERAEWAYLNRPDRLRELATLNFDRLGLFPMEPAQFAPPGEIAYPAPPVALVIENPVDTSASAESETAPVSPSAGQELFP